MRHYHIFRTANMKTFMWFTRRLRLPAIVFVILALEGCVGIAANGNVTSVFDRPMMGDKGTLYPDRPLSSRLTKQDVRTRWGEPDRIDLDMDGSERWDYRFGYRWNGVAIGAVLVPLPLYVPVGREHIYVYFKDDEVTRSEIFTDHIRLYAGCYLFIFHAKGLNCVSGSTPRVVHNEEMIVSVPSRN